MLVVTKMDRLGRTAMDVAGTVAKLAKMGVRVHCLQLGSTDLTSAAGKMIMGMLNTFAEFERDLLIERTQAGLARAKAAGKHLTLTSRGRRAGECRRAVAIKLRSGRRFPRARH